MAWVCAGDRGRALVAFRRTVELDEDNSWARFVLRHLDPDLAYVETEGWRTPFALADLFRSPSAEEIRQVRRKEWVPGRPTLLRRGLFVMKPTIVK